MSLFWKLVDETQMVAPRKYTDAFIIIKKLFLGVLRGLQSNSIQYERPCITKNVNVCQQVEKTAQLMSDKFRISDQ